MLTDDPYFLTSLLEQSYSHQICRINDFVKKRLYFMDKYIAGRSNDVTKLQPSKTVSMIKKYHNH